jgi:hypothetical protein
MAVVFFVTAWMSAAVSRVAEFRRGVRPALQVRGIDRRRTALLFVGTAPWLAMGYLRATYPTAAIWIPVGVAPGLRAVGLALAIAAVAEPFIRHRVRQPHSAPAPAEDWFSISVLIRIGAIVLLSGSPVFAVLSGLWLAMALWSASEPFRFSLQILPRHKFLIPLPPR